MKTTILVIYGGPGNEHEVSIASAENVIASLNQDLYDVQKVFVQKNMSCVLHGEEVPLLEMLQKISKSSIIIPVFHGSFGEGGELQKMLEDLNLVYVGSKSHAAALAMDKKRTQELLSLQGILVPKTVVVTSLSQEIDSIFPSIVKPNNEGSSIDLYRIGNKEELHEVLTKVIPLHSEVLVQEFVTGREFTCGVIEKKNELFAFMPTEIILTKGELFDYTAKYSVGGCQEITPANVSLHITQEIQKLAIDAHKTIGCKDISRTDMMIKDDGTIVVLEVNTMPGMTKTSFIPAQAKASGYTLSEILDIVIHNYL